MLKIKCDHYYFSFFRYSQEVRSTGRHQSYRQDALPHKTRETAEERSGHLAGADTLFLAQYSHDYFL